jgi:hypothetical protein
MRRRVIYILVLVVLFPVLQTTGVECDRYGYANAGPAFFLAATILKLALLILLASLLISVSRQAINRRAIYVLAVVLLFPFLQKAGIECSQHGYAISGSWLVSLANILKVVFLVLLIALLVAATRRYRNPFVQFLVAALFLPLFLLSCTVTTFSGRIILNASRPAWPQVFIRDQSAVSQLTDLANEMIQRRRVTWVGNSRWRFVFDINDGDAARPARATKNAC